MTNKKILTLGEAKQMTYAELEKTCEEFNNHGLSAKDIEKAWDNNWWEGFDACLEMVLNHLDNCDEVTGFRECLKESIIKEAELYKKDG